MKESLKFVLILALLAGFFLYVPFSDIKVVLEKVTLLPFVLSILVSLVSNYVTSIELWVLTRKQGISIPVSQLFLINLSVRFYSFFSPLSSIGALLRWQRLSGEGKAVEGLAAVTANRVFDIFVAIAVGLFWAITALNHEMVNIPVMVAYLVGILVLFWLALRSSGSLSAWFEGRAVLNANKLRAKIYGLLARAFRSVETYRSFSTSELLVLTFTAVLGELITLSAYVLVALSLQIPISIVDLGWMRALLFLSALAPFTLAGGFGLREVSTVILMSGLGIPATQAAAYSLLAYFRSVVVSLIGGAVELVTLLMDQKKAHSA